MGKEILFQALRGGKVERAPWVPFVGCHGGALIGADATTYLQSADLMVRGIRQAIQLYKPDGIPVCFDLSIEAEAIGCHLQWAKENPPAVSSHILNEKALAELVQIEATSGRIPLMLETVRQLRQNDEDVALYGLITGPFTLALHLKGTTIFMDMYDNPEEVHALLGFCSKTAERMADYLIDAGCDIISLVDPMTSQISPAAFQQFVGPYVKSFFERVRHKGHLTSFFVCGHAQKNVEAMCQTRPDNISVDENIPLDYVKDVCTRYNISFGGNLQLTVVLLLGDESAVQRNTLDCLQIGGNHGFVLAPGCDLPYSVPPKNLQIVTELVHDSYKRRVTAELLSERIEVGTSIDLADYGKSEKIIVDVITLDSESCAPCQYMVEAVRSVVDLFPDLVIWREHKIKERESIEFMFGLMVKNVPTICIDGQIKFVSTIPTRQELIQAIQMCINEKYSLKIWQRRGRLLLFTDRSKASEETLSNIKLAIRELGSNVQVRTISDPAIIAEYNIHKLPAVISVRENVKIDGRVPSVEVVKEWLKECE